MVVKKGGERTMELLKRLVVEEEGQGLVEYTLIVLLVALVFWVAVKGTNADLALKNAWGDIVACLNGGTAGC
jgi:Flp pilus assembly pilin Flp